MILWQIAQQGYVSLRKKIYVTVKVIWFFSQETYKMWNTAEQDKYNTSSC